MMNAVQQSNRRLLCVILDTRDMRNKAKTALYRTARSESFPEVCTVKKGQVIEQNINSRIAESVFGWSKYRPKYTTCSMVRKIATTPLTEKCHLTVKYSSAKRMEEDWARDVITQRTVEWEGLKHQQQLSINLHLPRVFSLGLRIKFLKIQSPVFFRFRRSYGNTCRNLIDYLFMELIFTIFWYAVAGRSQHFWLANTATFRSTVVISKVWRLDRFICFAICLIRATAIFRNSKAPLIRKYKSAEFQVDFHFSFRIPP